MSGNSTYPKYFGKYGESLIVLYISILYFDASFIIKIVFKSLETEALPDIKSEKVSKPLLDEVSSLLAASICVTLLADRSKIQLLASE